MKRGEVWWVDFDPALGSEIKKRRPAIIVSNDSANRNLSRVIVVPLTSNVSNVFPGEALIKIGAPPTINRHPCEGRGPAFFSPHAQRSWFPDFAGMTELNSKIRYLPAR
jgi:hypothetical protein